MRIGIKTRVGLASMAAGAAVISFAAPASADYAPSGSDSVGVGSDTVQYLTDFGADGSATGDAGYNSAGNKNKLVDFDATPDANARAAYANGSTSAALKPLFPTVVLRAGTSPVRRPNGSSEGIAALDADIAAGTHNIDFARASRLPTSTEMANGLYVVRIAKEDLGIAVATASVAPSALTKLELYNIYQCKTGYTTFNGTGIGGSSADTIIPLIPQSGSGTRNTFLDDIGSAGGTGATVYDHNSFPLGGCVHTVEENDPSALNDNATDQADAIAPFSGSRINLFGTGYFKDPTVVYGATPTTLTANVHLLTGANSYDDQRGLYIVMRAADATASSSSLVGPFQPGGTKNFAQTLFVGATSYFASPNGGQPDISDAGATPSYDNCGTVLTSC